MIHPACGSALTDSAALGATTCVTTHLQTRALAHAATGVTTHAAVRCAARQVRRAARQLRPLLVVAALLPGCQSFAADGHGDVAFRGAFAGTDYSTLHGTSTMLGAFEQGELPDLPPAAARPGDPWVLRCVLDQRPRMLVIELGDELCLAYDTQSGTLAKAWLGDVNFDGPVYTTVHGPQPTSRGEELNDPLAGSTWLLAPGEPARVQFSGYTLKEGHVTLQWNLRRPDGASLAPDAPPYACVLETPEVTRDAKGKPALLRLFEVFAPPDSTLLLQQDTCTADAWLHLRADCAGSKVQGVDFMESNAGLGFTMQLSQGRTLLTKSFEQPGAP